MATYKFPDILKKVNDFDALTINARSISTDSANKNVSYIFEKKFQISTLCENFVIEDKIAEKTSDVEFIFHDKNTIKQTFIVNIKDIQQISKQTPSATPLPVSPEKKESVTPVEIKRATLEINGFEEVRVRHYENWFKCSDEYVGKFKGYAKYENLSLIKKEELDYLNQDVFFPETGILEVEDGIFSNRGIVYTRDMTGRFLEVSKFSDVDRVITDEQELQMYRNLQLNNICGKNVKYLKGRCLNLLPFFSNYNYCHSLLETSCMLDMIFSYGVNADDFDWFLLPKNKSPLLKEIYKLSGINLNKAIEGGRMVVDHNIKNSPHGWLFDSIVSPSTANYGAFYNAKHFSYLRKLFVDDLPSAKKKHRIFLDREGGGRDISNQDELLDLLHQYDFKIVYPSKQADIPTLMHNAEIVIGAHGAAMANCVFCSPGSILIDLMPKYYVKPYFMSLAYAMDMKYYGIFCEESASISKDSLSTASHSRRSFSVFVPQLKKLLEEICA